jgi:SAM-dependent methyltransferase
MADTRIDASVLGLQTSITAFVKTVEAKPHTPIYMMHKYFARRPWNVFRELVSHYTSPDDIILDPFCGGGVTAVEALKLRRKVVSADLNPLATYVTRMEVTPADLDVLQQSFVRLGERVKKTIVSFYVTKCTKCKAKAFADWIEWDEASKRIKRLKFDCPVCGYSGEKAPRQEDLDLASGFEGKFSDHAAKQEFWYPITKIPPGDKTSSLLADGINYFYELFTKRNLLALTLIRSEIEKIGNKTAREFLAFTLSSSLKWSSKQSHMRDQIVEGWAMHAYWIYPRSLEINVWNTFERRFQAVIRGKRYSNQYIGKCSLVESFEEVQRTPHSCLILTTNSARLPLPDSSIDAVITDPPYGGNVNYAELSDYWVVWTSRGKTTPKDEEAIINKTRSKTLKDYQNALYNVFKECHRVLKPGHAFVSTFNSKDLRVVASFVTAASQAGFALHPDGLLYQKPIRAYTTTFHAMQIGAFVGDYIFTFVKENGVDVDPSAAAQELAKYKLYLIGLIEKSIKTTTTEPELREEAYRTLIPFISRYARAAPSLCSEAVDFFEAEMNLYGNHFKEIREKMITKRRTYYRETNRRHPDQSTLDKVVPIAKKRSRH